MRYEPLYERFEASGAEGKRRSVEFVKSGFLTVGDRPELFFFRVDGEEAVVGISGGALDRFQTGRRRFSREEKVDLAGLWLKRQLEAGTPLDSAHLLLRDEDLGRTAAELGFVK
ncbi:MAG: hypothetical protein ACLP1Y_08045 [Candidatus Acidiferrales bacterium]